MGKMSLDSDFSTTSFLYTTQPFNHKSDLEKGLLLPPNPARKNEGGLRMKGYYCQNLPNKPLISVITVVFNGGEYIEDCILSVVRQSYKNVEFIIIDAASQNDTTHILEKYNEKISYWVSEKDLGLYDGMNKGVSLALGDYVYFLGVDDRLVPNSLLRVADFIISNNCSSTVIYGDVYMPSKHIFYDGKFSKLKLSQKNICHQAIFYPKHVFDNEKFNLKYRVWADYDLNIRLFAKYSFYYLPILIAYYNDSGFSSKNRDLLFQKDYLKIIKKSWGLHFFLLLSCRIVLAKIKNKFFS